MNDHHHDGCPHDHEGDSCLFGVADSPDTTGDVEESSVEETEIVADAAVEIAEIEAETQREAMELQTETERLRIEAELEHHQISSDESIEHHEIEAGAQDDLEEVVEELEEAVTELEETLDDSHDDGDADDVLDGDEGDVEGDATLVSPPPRIEPPGATAKARRQSSFTRRHSRRR